MKQTIQKIRSSVSPHKRKLLILLMVLTVLEAIFVSATGLVKQLVEAVPVAILVSIISESLFIIGIGIMGISAGQALGWNILTWRRHIESLMKTVSADKWFLLGFWINFVGALGTGLVWLIVILVTLPPSGWLFLWLPVVDIILTFAVRAAFADVVSLKFGGRRS